MLSMRIQHRNVLDLLLWVKGFLEVIGMTVVVVV